MQEFILIIHAEGNPISLLPAAQQQKHIEKVSKFIDTLTKAGLLKDAKPLMPEGTVVSGVKESMNTTHLELTRGNIAGYYHLCVTDMNEAIGIAQSDPRFEDAGWSIEIRPVLVIDGISK